MPEKESQKWEGFLDESFTQCADMINSRLGLLNANMKLTAEKHHQKVVESQNDIYINPKDHDALAQRTHGITAMVGAWTRMYEQLPMFERYHVGVVAAYIDLVVEVAQVNREGPYLDVLKPVLVQTNNDMQLHEWMEGRRREIEGRRRQAS